MTGLVKAQVIIYVREMENSLKFYRDGLGFVVSYPVDGQLNEHWMTLDAGGLSLALHGGSSGELGSDAPGLSFIVEDLESVLAEVRSRGLEFSDPVNPHPGVVFSTGSDPDGHTVTLNQA